MCRSTALYSSLFFSCIKKKAEALVSTFFPQKIEELQVLLKVSVQIEETNNRDKLQKDEKSSNLFSKQKGLAGIVPCAKRVSKTDVPFMSRY